MDNDPSKEVTVFAKTNFRNQEVPFGIKTDDRRRHMYIIGKTGMGKTTLMENMIIQDIMNGKGLAFVDPHGDSVEKILDYIPSNRVNDVVYFNPADQDFPIAFNILESVDPSYKHLVASGLMGVFTKIWANTWSARMEYILNNAILALLDSPGNTLLGIARMIVDKKYRKKIVDNIKDPMVRSFWVDEFANWPDKYRMEAVAPIQNKVGQFLSTSIIRNIIGQPKSTLDLREIMDDKKILLLNLSKGRLGEDNSALLGAMIITKLQLAALSRVDILEHDREDFYLYVDEFQNFATQSFATILSEARKYRLNLIIGHQYIGQLVGSDRNTEVRDAVFGNVGTIACFRVGATDAEFLEKEFFPTFVEGDLLNLPKYHIILRLMINGVASDPFSATTLSPAAYQKTANREKVVRVSRERYANPAVSVMKKITEWMGQEYHEGVAVVATGAKIEGREDDEDEELEPKVSVTAGEPNRTVVEVVQPVALPIEPEAPMPAPPTAATQTAKISVEMTIPELKTPNESIEILEPEPAPVSKPAVSAPQAPQAEHRQLKPRPQQAQQSQQHHSNHETGHHPERRNSARRKNGNPNQRRENPIWDKINGANADHNNDLANTIAAGIKNKLKPIQSQQPHQQHQQQPQQPRHSSHQTSRIENQPEQGPSEHHDNNQRVILKPGERQKF